MRILNAQIELGDAPPTGNNPWNSLYMACDSQLEKKFLDLLKQHGFQRPTHAQYLIEEKYSKPDFYYQEGSVCVFIDGPPHDTPEQTEDDLKVRQKLVFDGYTVLVFHHQKTDWLSLVQANPQVFGTAFKVEGVQV